MTHYKLVSGNACVNTRPKQSAKIIFKAKLSFKSRAKLHSLKQNSYESFICLCKLNIITNELLRQEKPTKNDGLFIVQLQNYQPEAHYAAKLENGADMNLQPDECDQFYRIWWSLLIYVNKQMKLFNDFSKPA